MIEEDANLQQTAAIADHLIPTLANYLRKNDLSDGDYARMREVVSCFYCFILYIMYLHMSGTNLVTVVSDLVQATFLVCNIEKNIHST